MTDLTASEMRNAMVRAVEKTARRFPKNKPSQLPTPPLPTDEGNETAVRRETSTSVDWTDIQMAFEYVSTGRPGENQAHLNWKTGDIVFYSSFGDNFEEFPDDIDDEKYLPIPHKKELGLGKNLVLAFVERCLPGDIDVVEQIFRRKGAYARFFDLLDRRRARDRWYAFQNKAEEEALRDWCADNSIQVIDK
jgi:hypothetical protein